MVDCEQQKPWLEKPWIRGACYKDYCKADVKQSVWMGFVIRKVLDFLCS